jgi:hypothetical protein
MDIREFYSTSTNTSSGFLGQGATRKSLSPFDAHRAYRVPFASPEGAFHG